MQVQWDDRKLHQMPGQKFFVTVDGTNCQVHETQPIDPSYMSHKLNKAAMRYEIAVLLNTGLAVWVNGPFCAGLYTNYTIFMESLVGYVDDDEQVEADNGYKGIAQVRIPSDAYDADDYEAKKRARLRHETFNSCLKRFCCLSSPFCGKYNDHSMHFYAVLAVMQTSIMDGRSLLDF